MSVHRVPEKLDDENTTSFLNIEKFYRIQGLIKRFQDTSCKLTKKRDILKLSEKTFRFESVFENMGVQGITGVLNLSALKMDECCRIVFKISTDLDRSVEHEYLITKELNTLRPYCPHFMGNLGMISLPISNDFLSDPAHVNLFKPSNDFFPHNVLLTEYVSSISLYHICKYLHEQPSIIMSQIIQIMLALDIAQTKVKLTQYDLHLDNILIRSIDQNTLFLYKHKNKNILVPTYGLYPVIIDFGTSYTRSVEGKPMYSDLDNYQNGLQPTLYDNLNDVHHLLLSMLSYLEYKNENYRWLRNRLMYIFRHLPILAEKGWKQLPHDILDIILHKIDSTMPKIKNFSVYQTYKSYILELLGGLIILPWTDGGNSDLEDCLEPFLKQFQLLNEIDSLEPEAILYMFRELIDIINSKPELRESYIKGESTPIKLLINEWKEKIAFIIHNNMKSIPKTVNFEILVSNAIKLADRLSTNYYHIIKEHVNIINEGYLQTPITCPLDMALLVMQNCTPSFKVTNESKIFIWDAVKETKSVISLKSIPKDKLEKINNSSYNQKGDILINVVEKSTPR